MNHFTALLPRAAIALLLSPLGCASGSAVVSLAPVEVTLPPPAPPTPAPPLDPGEAHASTDDRAAELAGSWSETFMGRPGCSDIVTITEERGVLALKSEDCNDGAAYTAEEAAFDGTTLRVQLRVPETGYVVRYRLTREGRDRLAGKGETIGPDGDEQTFDVSWNRTSKARDFPTRARDPKPAGAHP